MDVSDQITAFVKNSFPAEEFDLYIELVSRAIAGIGIELENTLPTQILDEQEYSAVLKVDWKEQKCCWEGFQQQIDLTAIAYESSTQIGMATEDCNSLADIILKGLECGDLSLSGFDRIDVCKFHYSLEDKPEDLETTLWEYLQKHPWRAFLIPFVPIIILLSLAATAGQYITGDQPRGFPSGCAGACFGVSTAVVFILVIIITLTNGW